MLECIDEENEFVEYTFEPIKLKNMVNEHRSFVLKDGTLTCAFRLESASSLNVKVWFSPNPYRLPKCVCLKKTSFDIVSRLLLKSSFTVCEGHSVQPVYAT